VAPSHGQAVREVLVAPCETSPIDVGAPGTRVTLAYGFGSSVRNEAGRTFAPIQSDVLVRIALTTSSERTLRLTGKAVEDGLRASVFWNGVELEPREFDRRWRAVEWSLPEALVRVGLNRLEMSRESWESFRVDEIEVVPAAPCPIDQDPYLQLAELPLTLEAGAMLLHVFRSQPKSQFRVHVEGDPSAAIDLAAGADSGAMTSASEQVGAGREVPTPLFEACCEERAAMAMTVREGTARVLSVEEAPDRSQSAWRRCCRGVVPLELGAMIFLVLAVWWLRRHPGAVLPWERCSPWLDALLIVAFALLVRLIFIWTHAPIDARLNPDSWEYLHRARMLFDGRADFWSDTRWHRWQSWTRAPGYFVILAWAMSFGLKSLAYLQAVFVAIAAGGSYFIAYPLFGRRAAVAAGILFAAYAETILIVNWVLTEASFLVFLVPALACLSWAAARSGRLVPFAGGVLFGLAALVRSAPVYFVPAAACLLLLIRRPNRSRPAIYLVLGFVLTIAPWCIRNSVISGFPTGIDNIAVYNFLFANPTEKHAAPGIDLDTRDGRRRYRRQLRGANRGDALSRQSGRILAEGLVDKVLEPRQTMSRFAQRAENYFGLMEHRQLRRLMRARSPCEAALWVDAINVGYLVVMLLGIAGILMTVRDRRTWPVLLWALYTTFVVTVLFFNTLEYGRFRQPIVPVLAAFAGAAIVRLIDRESGARATQRESGTIGH
jgi:4-amino-4-deoxy-L-arabinose transferase-like glycosyltransferase